LFARISPSRRPFPSRRGCRRRPTPRLHCRALPLLGEPHDPLSRLPSQQSRQLAGDRPCPRHPAG
jgi:hypothetical protein